MGSSAIVRYFESQEFRDTPEVKAYIEDLLNRNFIRQSYSPYSSPVVCVRKKDQTLIKTVS